MADAGFFKGTSADQDRRFSDKELKLLKTMKFPPEFEKKVDMRKVNLSVIRPWIVKKVVELVGFEDEVVVEYAMGLLEDDSQPTPDPRRMQINLTGFLTNSTTKFMSALWSLLIEAQDSPAGVPRTFVEEKKEEMRQARAGDVRAVEERDRRARLDEIRENERADRVSRGGGRGRGRGRGRGFDDDRGGRGRDNGWASWTAPFTLTPTSITPAAPSTPIPIALSRLQHTQLTLAFPYAFTRSRWAPLPFSSSAQGPVALPWPPSSSASAAQVLVSISLAISPASSTPASAITLVLATGSPHARLA
ncbi:PWI domain-containing protein [Obba rivulosa]|uniref:PWI domain-containing protein n=1 Tax=Obba rivulosa TaxID=1052685 RepID=A0A8E2ALL9_9APHY|nr:PWI domain-containing protein [Obba rivulosa]